MGRDPSEGTGTQRSPTPDDHLEAPWVQLAQVPRVEPQSPSHSGNKAFK
jgi:hypothetical protein